MYEPPNRGGKTINAMNRGVGGNDPGSVTDPTRACQLVPDAARLHDRRSAAGTSSAGTSTANFNSMINLPVAKNPDGSSITGPSYEYIVMGNATTQSSELIYPAATLDKSKAVLTTRKLLNDVPQVVPASGWEYVDETHIRLLPAGTAFKPGRHLRVQLHRQGPDGERHRLRRDPRLRWRSCATRRRTIPATPNPMAGDITRVYTEISSQPGRMFNDFRKLGFNQAESGQKVFDGHMQWIAAGERHQHEPALLATGPHRAQPSGPPVRGRGVPVRARDELTDHITGKTAGRYDRCTASNTCPFAMEIYSANEYWVKTASLFHTDTTGHA